MNKMKTINDFINSFSLSKTLRFELKPVGRTLEHITNSGLLQEDNNRAENYQKVKKIIDNYHKVFIEDVLDRTALKIEDNGNKDSLTEYYFYYMCKSKDEKGNLDSVAENLRKQIANSFSKDIRFKNLNKKELIQKDLMDFVSDPEDKSLVNKFEKFTTYFTGFHENRQNMYSAEAKSTAIAYRLIHENLPKFIDNISIFEKVSASPIANNLAALYAEFEPYLNVCAFNEMFRLNYYNTVLTQRQIDVYNAIIGGMSLEDGTKIKGLNEYINLYNQQQKDKSTRIPKLKPLYKQILSDREAISWLPEQFTSDEEVLEAIQKTYQELNDYVLNKQVEGEYSLKNILLSLSDFDLNKIYIRNEQLFTDFSQKVFGHWEIISKALCENIKLTCLQKKKETTEEYNERITKVLKSQSSVSIAQIQQCIQDSGINTDNNIANYFSSLGAINTAKIQKENIFYQIENAYADVKDLLNSPYPTEKNLAQDNINISKIQVLLDSIKSLLHFIKPLLGDGKESDKDEKFYSEFSSLHDKLDKIIPLYNKVRNYITRKPYSTEKIKLNFENSTLMDGWDVNKERDNTTVILRRDGLYYLAIMNKKHNRVFDVQNTHSHGECYEKMEYKQIADAGKDIQNLICVNGNFQRFTKNLDNLKQQYIPQIYKIKQKESYKQNSNFNINDLYTYIDYYKKAAKSYWNWCDFSFKPTESYSSWKEFTDHINKQGYKISFRQVSVDYIDSLVDEGKIYLFQIYSKDFSPYSKGTPNLHTIYWNMLFDERNLANVVYKLNGEAEVFYRKKSISYDHPTHPANQPIDNKNPLNEKKQSTFEYDIIKNKRYTLDKFLFHVPITFNFKSAGIDNINSSVNQFIKESDDIHIIGIDRGERHLLYLTLINSKGEIIQQFSLNEIVNSFNGNEFHTNYHDLLVKREDERMKARQSWQTIESIKELKEGYLSQVINLISKLMVQYNAIVVLEDLNLGFMRGRQKVEASVYQKFEKMLIDKLNYLVDKKQQPELPGGALKAYQFTNKFTSFQKLGKQCGFLFYTPAWNTSKIDPVTGFVNLFDTRYETREKSKAFFSKFDIIKYNQDKDWFEFSFDYNKFTTKAEGTRTHWTLCTYGNRIENKRDANQNNNWVSQEFVLTQEFKDFFAKHNIDINSNLKEEIARQDSTEFFKGLLHLLKLTLQIRNSAIGSDIDYMQSPIADENGTFYNSNTCEDYLPKNADANGAYNIARKGLWMVKQIKESTDFKDLRLSISNKEWLSFAQSKPYKNK